MEPVTHVLTGACLARTGLNRKAAYATAAMAIAAEFPDVDTLWGLRGPVSSFEHHRGITHTFLGLPLEAGFLLLCFILFHRWRVIRRSGGSTESSESSTGVRTKAPIRWAFLYGLILLALLSHILLDYTNNYGIRPFFPFDNHWYAASIVFIFDPYLFLLLVGGLLLPALFALIGREIGAKREPFQGRAWACTALVIVVLFWTVRAIEHSRALAVARAEILRAPGTMVAAGTEQVDENAVVSEEFRPLLRAKASIASPDPFSIFRWYSVVDFGSSYALGTVDSRVSAWMPDQVLNKALPNQSFEAAERSRLGRRYLDWSSMPLMSIVRSDSRGSDLSDDVPAGGAVVIFRDLRFLGGPAILNRNGRTPLTGMVVLDASDQVQREGMDGRYER